jgi:hypothetical protein
VAKPRVFVVLDKRATRTQLERAFRETCEGVDSVDLKKDARGASRGFAYVTFAEPAHAFAAAERLDGAEIPPGSGKRAKVMPAEKPPRRRRGARGKSAEASRDFGLGGTRAVSGGLSTYYDVGGFVTEKERDAPFSQTNFCKRTGERERDTARGERERDKPSAAALRRPREEEGDEGVSSWQPPPGKYPRVLAAAAADSEDEDAEVASSLRTASLALTARASRLATEDEAGEAAAALGKVSLGTRGKASLAVPGGPEGGEERDRLTKDKSESFGAKAGDARVFAAEARAASETSDEGTETRTAGSNRVVFFSLALPLPSYAVRHVLDAKGVVAKLHMSRGGASGWAEYAEAEDAAAAAAALDGTEILGIEFRVAATRPEGDALTGPEGAERLGDDASEGSERHEAGAETNVFETNALETRAGEREGVAAKKRARIAATAGS